MKNYCDIKSEIIRIAVEEEGVWTDSNGNKRDENEAGMLPELERYWGAVPGVNAHTLAIESANDTGAWSAAFICSVFSDAGIDLSDGFIFARKHIRYIVGSLKNRENADTTKPFWLYDNIEILHEALPQRGDLICYNRFNDRGVYSNHSYSSLRDLYMNNNDVPTGVSHCNIVGSITESEGNQIIGTIGGNINGSVRYTYLIIQNGQIMEVDEDGSNPRVENDIFAIIKNIECDGF